MQRFGRHDWKTDECGAENCFLLTNGLGGYCSLAMNGANTRDDHALFMAAEKAPNYRYHYVTGLQEILEIDDQTYDLSAQTYAAHTKNGRGCQYLRMFAYEDFPVWTYHVDGITIRKQIVMMHEENTVGVSYRIQAPKGTKAVLRVLPLLKFAVKNHQPEKNQMYELDETSVRSDGRTMYYRTNAEVWKTEEYRIEDLYFVYDARDGRDCIGGAVINHEYRLSYTGKSLQQDGACEYEIIYSDRPVKARTVKAMCEAEQARLRSLEAAAGFRSAAANCLVRSADQFLVKRASTGGDTIIAGYPFFGDWGRDTMIAVLGCAIETRQYERAKSILQTFASYCRRGLMPNLFPEGEDEPLYNTADASLWFVEAVYEYQKASGDSEFVGQMLPIIEDIIYWYKRGTDFHVFMDADALICAGAGEEQVTWMDVRFGDILPTSRHGKPVEINALWYNALCIAAELSGKEEYTELAARVKQSFLEKFWMEEMGCLRDVLSLEEERRYADTQIRCNQVWELSLPYSMLDEEKAEKILDVIERKLYTPNGLRTLSSDDPQFCAKCCGSQFDRDMAYHQGTVWVFPLGAYLQGILRWGTNEKRLETVQEKLALFELSLREGCIGQAAEIYDGEDQIESRGCYAQAWSVGEMLRVYRKVEELLGLGKKQ